MSSINEILEERRTKLQILYLKKADLENEIKEKEEELRYFEEKKEVKPAS